MDENKKETQVPAEGERDQALFDAIGKDKKRRKRRAWITAVVIVALVAAGLTAAVIYGQKKVRDRVDSMNVGSTQVLSYTVDTGSVNDGYIQAALRSKSSKRMKLRVKKGGDTLTYDLNGNAVK